jgi:glycosyltransferase involved in cell wall biosynthesis
MIPYLRARGFDVDFQPFLDEDFLRGFYQRGNRLSKAAGVALRTIARLSSTIAVTDVDAVFIQREAALIGPPYAEMILSSLKGLPIIFDFDDAIWDINPQRSTHPLAAKMLKNPSKAWYTMARAACVITGSSYLAERAREVSSRVEVVPTVVPSATWTSKPCRFAGKFCHENAPRIGWVGTHTTANQLKLVEPALRQLRSEGYEFQVHVVGAGEGFTLRSVEVESRPWRLEREIEEFRRIDIGLAPMFSEPVYQGKCGFKQLQYMAVGVPFISSWVGGARDFVVDGEVGLVAHDAADWYRQLKALLDSAELRRSLSENGLKLVKERYSAEVQGPRVARIVEEALAAGP